MTSSFWPKTCGCGARWSREAWRTLEHVGTMSVVSDEPLELRQCTCRSTLAVPVALMRTPSGHELTPSGRHRSASPSQP